MTQAQQDLVDAQKRLFDLENQLTAAENVCATDAATTDAAQKFATVGVAAENNARQQQATKAYFDALNQQQADIAACHALVDQVGAQQQLVATALANTRQNPGAVEDVSHTSKPFTT